MLSKVAIVYNQPETSRYDLAGESAAVVGVLEAVNAVRQALIDLRKEVIEVPLLPPPTRVREALVALSSWSLVFNLFEGFCGLPSTEALVPEIAEELSLPYTGCPGSALRLALDKGKTKSVLLAHGIPTPRFQLLTLASLGRFSLRFPCIVKPVAEDASHGLSEDSVVRDTASLSQQVTQVSERFGGEALVEEFIEGREFNATVLGSRKPYALPPSEIIYSLPPDKPRLLTFAAKWQSGAAYYSGTQPVCPAPVDAALGERINAMAVEAFGITGCRGYARVDMRQDGQGNLQVLEINPNPDIAPGAGAAKQAKAAGMDYTRFVETIMKLALEGIP